MPLPLCAACSATLVADAIFLPHSLLPLEPRHPSLLRPNYTPCWAVLSLPQHSVPTVDRGGKASTGSSTRFVPHAHTLDHARAVHTTRTRVHAPRRGRRPGSACETLVAGTCGHTPTHPTLPPHHPTSVALPHGSRAGHGLAPAEQSHCLLGSRAGYGLASAEQSRCLPDSRAGDSLESRAAPGRARNINIS